MHEPVILEAVRVPFGRRGGYYRNTPPDSLLAHVLRALVQRAGLAATAVEDVIAGCVTQAGEQGANVARLALLLADFPPTVPGVTLDRMCGSSQQAVHFAAQAIAAGDMTFVVAAGVENMTRVPMFSSIGGGFEQLSQLLHEKYELIHQGESAERMAEKWGVTRAELDAFAAESHRRAAEAARNGRHAELVAVEGLDADGRVCHPTHDEGIRFQLDPRRMAALAPAFRPAGQGVVTAANASQIADGAAAVLLGERAAAEAAGLRPRARFLARVVVGDDPTMQLSGVIPATRLALARASLTLAEIDWIEINEAFASVVLAWAREFAPDMARVNPWGGAIAHGHPLGASGAGLMAKMVAGLEAINGRFGLQTMCIGHGMATATIIERIV